MHTAKCHPGSHLRRAQRQTPLRSRRASCPTARRSLDFALSISHRQSDSRHVLLTRQNLAIPAHFGRPILGFLILAAQLAKLILERERQDVDKVIVGSLRLFAVGETLPLIEGHSCYEPLTVT